MNKELFIACHEPLVNEYMDENSTDDWQEAYDATADKAYDRMRDVLADRADDLRQRRKEGLA